MPLISAGVSCPRHVIVDITNWTFEAGCQRINVIADSALQHRIQMSRVSKV